LVEVEASAVPPATVVAELSKVISHAWREGVPVVASCKFEDELPWSGGIQRLEG
jgi:hypothetical protein